MVRLIVISLFLCACASGPGGMPPDHHLLYQQDFEGEDAPKFWFSADAEWKIGGQESRSLELLGGKAYKPPVRSPRNIALIAGHKFGDFVLEANLRQTGREYGHRDLCLFFGYQDPSHFYYVHIATKADPHAHNIFVVDGKPRVAIASRTTAGIDWGEDQWHHVRLERALADGRIRVIFDGQPLMEADSKRFRAGMIGFGSFDDQGEFDEIKVWGPASMPVKADPFSGK